ncbi:GNAT family N-acetyltransferase [Veronia pacifica]|uniref:Acyltransferase MbtK/IucB-like conserved domain-containing protein n=1 Tax=Veronia pacifica TaxID=1080227 RepID=A0A1C3ESE9_9GAMM|nr:GNAT family N-acetyltransferase [Veronia pacifica]ODA36170.1 hypothetical protein A8L45_00780 [Veronia pacifica]
MPIKIYRDKWGIPHIKANSELELVFAQGYNAAIDRGWQIEVDRLRAKGVSASVFGKKYIEWDKFARRVKFDDIAEECWKNLAPDNRQWVREYVKGINAGIRINSNPAFSKFGITPKQWDPWTPISMWISNHILMGGFASKIWREEVIECLGEEYLDYFKTEDFSRAESNGWYIPPTRTQSGKSILAGDPHRVVELPCSYQQIHLSCDEYDVVGLAIPGVPGIAHFAHKSSVAWSITNAMADYQDLFFEKIVKKEQGYYSQGPDGEERVEFAKEIIEVKDSDSIEIDVLTTQRGPVIIEACHERLPISLKLPSSIYKVSGFETLRSLLKAQSADDVERAFSDWVEPVNVLQTSDRNGQFISRVVGRVPSRAKDNFTRIVPAWRPDTSWSGNVEGERNNNGEGIAVMANQRGLAARMGTEFSAIHRAQRISDLIEARDSWSADEMRKIHVDSHLTTASIITNMVSALSDLPDKVARLQTLLDRWDGNMSASCVEAALFAKLRANIVRNIASLPELNALLMAIEGHRYSTLFSPWLCIKSRVAFALNTILSAGFPNLQIEPVVRKSLVDLSLENNLDETWGEIHTVVPWTAYDNDNLLSWPGIGGDHDCVLSSYSLPGVTHACWRTPSARYIWDLENVESSQWVVQFGASDDPDHRHFSDQYKIWRKGEMVPVIVSWDKLAPESSISTVNDLERSASQVTDIGTFDIEPLDVARHIDVVYEWVTQDRAKYWGLLEYDRERIELIYEYLDVQFYHNAFIISHNNQPVSLIQLYDPKHDELGDKYRVMQGDIGLHILIAPKDLHLPNFTEKIFSLIKHFLMYDSRNRRIVVDPDVNNAKALNRFQRLGFSMADKVKLSTKIAQLFYFNLTV